MSGWISLHRKILDNPILSDSSRYNKKCAWIWLLLKANHKDNKFVLGNDIIMVKRGSFVTSQKKLCKEFKWGNSKIRNFLKLLQKDGMIKVKTTSQATHITICNYDTYQDIQTANKSVINKKQTANKSKTNTNNNDNKVNNVNNILTNKDYLDKYGYNMLKAFVDYWTEKKPNGKKEKWYMEKTFDVNLRLKKWADNDFDGYYKQHKQDLINKEQDEYYRKASEKVSAEETERQQQEIKNITKNMFRKV